MSDERDQEAEEGCGSDCSAAALHADPEIAVVMRGQLPDLQRAADRLEHRGIESTIVRADSEDAAGCCTSALYLVVARDDAGGAMEVFDSEWKRGLSDEQIAALEAATRLVIDPESAETTCPACLTTFATGPDACPDCGLALG